MQYAKIVVIYYVR